MRAILQPRYGSPDVLIPGEIDRPTPEAGEVCVRVHSTCVSAGDWHMLTATWFVVRLIGGLRRPRHQVLGFDVSGVVESVGSGVTGFRPGDEVFGGNETGGAFAEYMTLPEDGLALKPEGVSHLEAGVVPSSGLTALHGLRDKARVQPGQSVLINGASGGVGNYAVQIAKILGGEVTGVCRGSNGDFVRSIGADHVIDYTQRDFTREEARYDVILDMVGNRPIGACKRALTPTGVYIAVAGHPLRSLRAHLFGGKRAVSYISQARRRDLEVLGEWLASGQLVPRIDRVFDLADVPDALRAFGAGGIQGKLAVRVVG